MSFSDCCPLLWSWKKRHVDSFWQLWEQFTRYVFEVDADETEETKETFETLSEESNQQVLDRSSMEEDSIFIDMPEFLRNRHESHESRDDDTASVESDDAYVFL